MKSIIILTLLFLTYLDASSAQNIRPELIDDTGKFSDFKIHDESGDIGGMEIYIINGNKDEFAIIHEAAGCYLDPILVSLEKTQKKHVFLYDKKNGDERYRCTLTISAMEALNECKINNQLRVNRLKRKQYMP